MKATNTVPGEKYYYRFEGIGDDKGSDACETGGSTVPITLEKYPKPPKGNPKFWRRQFGTEVTRSQRRFDWIAGVFLPLACFYFDPIVFREFGYSEGGLLRDYQPFAYTLAFTSIMAMAAWLLWGERLRGLSAFLAGTFFAASAVSLTIGIILFPFSLVGMLLLIGFLGFTPLFTAICLARNGVRAVRTSAASFDKGTLTYIVSISALAILVVGFVMNANLR